MDWNKDQIEYVNHMIAFHQRMLDKALAFEKETKEKYHNVSFMWEYIKYAKNRRKYWEAELKYWQKQL